MKWLGGSKNCGRNAPHPWLSASTGIVSPHRRIMPKTGRAVKMPGTESVMSAKIGYFTGLEANIYTP